MSYTALYRKFRPAEFESVKGQEAIVTTLKNQIRANRIGHAYLFCGTRGTGKTTVAKIFAKAVNCEQPMEGSPCGVCASCQTIAAGASVNVIEIDAASNNGVDNIRNIREEVEYRPTEGRYKVYIIDEVHMLSIGAFNALLKTLEEPPEYVIFILATTEIHKIPITILSRCQHYSFKRITIDTIVARLQELMDEEEIEVEDKALRYIAKVADGSMRDALSLLDQCIAFYLGQKLTYDNVIEVLGAIDTDMFSALLRKLLNYEVAQVLAMLDDFVMQGRDLSQFVVDFAWYLRNLLLIKSSDNMEDILDVSSENLQQLKEETKMVDTDTLLRFIRIFSELSNQMRYATQKRILLEVALIKLCEPKMETSEDAVLGRVRKIEKQIEEGIVAKPSQTAGQVQVSQGIEAEEKQEKPIVLQQALPEEIREVAVKFAEIKRTIPDPLRMYLKQAIASMGENQQLLIVVEDRFMYEALERNKVELQSYIEGKVNRTIQMELRCADSGRPMEDVFVDITKVINMPIEIED